MPCTRVVYQSGIPLTREVNRDQRHVRTKVKHERKHAKQSTNKQIPNTKKFFKHYKWKPKIGFEKTLVDLLNYWREIISTKKNYPNR